MPATPAATPSGIDAKLQHFSCLTCRQRKVKCDRRDPCTNCVKAVRQCSFLPPVRGKRKKTKHVKEGLHARVKRYEALLKAYGADIESSEYVGDSDPESASQPDVAITEHNDLQAGCGVNSISVQEARPRLEVDQDGSSRYLDATPWANMGGEYPQYPKEDEVVGHIDEPSDDDSDVLLGSPLRPDFAPHAHSGPETTTSFHPPHHTLSRLWDTYADRVDPMVKVLHLPTFRASLTDAVERPDAVPRCLKALICAFYLVTITSLGEKECQTLMGLEKSSVFARYERATRRALKAAKLLRTSNPTTLRAYLLFVMGVRHSLTTDTAFTLSGVALRLARKMGLHRDSSVEFSAFETEMRRRLWWQIFHMDSRISGLLGINPSMDLLSADVKVPLNVLDDDLGPDMARLPPERKCITPLVICLIRCEMAQALRKLFANSSPRDSPDAMLAAREHAIGEIRDSLESRFLRYCDPTVALHSFVSILVRTSICVVTIKMGADDIRKFASMGVEAPNSERDIIFASATKMLEYLHLIRSNPALEKYMWQAGTSVLWIAVLWVLIEVRRRRAGPDVDQAWLLIGSVLVHYPQMFEKTTGAVYAVLGKWTLEAWDRHLVAGQAGEFVSPSTPDWIQAIQRCRSSDVQQPSATKDVPHLDFGAETNKPAQALNADTPSEVDIFASYDFSDLLSFEGDPAGWTQWESLLAVEDGGI